MEQLVQASYFLSGGRTTLRRAILDGSIGDSPLEREPGGPVD
jgi:hypothetical protein